MAGPIVIIVLLLCLSASLPRSSGAELEMLDLDAHKKGKGGGGGGGGGEKKRKALVMSDFPDHGLISQFLEVKHAFRLSLEADRSLSILTVSRTDAQGKVVKTLSSCELFDFPMGSGIQCSRKTAPKCKKSKREDILASEKKSAMYCGAVTLHEKGGRNDQIAALDDGPNPPFPLAFSVDMAESVALVKAMLGIRKKSKAHPNSFEYTVLSLSGMDAPLTADMLAEVKSLKTKNGVSASEVVTFAAAGAEPISAAARALLKEAGLKTIEDVWPDTLETVNREVMELGLMLGASLFLGFGSSAVNDLVEHERALDPRNVSSCVAFHAAAAFSPPTTALRGSISNPTSTPGASNPGGWCAFEAARVLQRAREEGSILGKVSKMLQEQVSGGEKQEGDATMDSRLHTELLLLGFLFTFGCIAILHCCRTRFIARFKDENDSV